MAASEQLKALVDQLPNSDGRGMYTSDMDKDKIEKTIAAIHQGGPANVEGIIEMLGEPGSKENVKPHYALHCLANHALIVKDEKARRRLVEIMAKALGDDRPVHIKAYLCQELGWAGRNEALAALGRLLNDEALCGPASMALVSIRRGAAEQFRLAWPKAKGPTRRHLMDALAELAESKSLNIFKEGLKDKDREVRIAAAVGLARVGDPTTVALLIAADREPSGWERIQMASSHLTLAEKLTAAGKKAEATRVYQHLQNSRTDKSEQHLREAAVRGLAALA